MKTNIPRHIAIVMDGNGRWATNQGRQRNVGHRAGVDAVKSTVNACLDKGIEVLSLFAFSYENWQRPAEEVNFLMDLLLESLRNEVGELRERQVRLMFSGDRSILNAALQEQMRQCELETNHNARLTVNVMINYSGRWDIVDTCRRIAMNVKEGVLSVDAIDESLFADQVSSHQIGDPDLFIRTSGELRISNFFLWQLSYSELYFSDVYWPDFNADELEKALQSYAQRQRRFGKVLEP